MNLRVEELEPRCVLNAATIPLQTSLLQADLVRELLPPPKIEPLPITIFTNPPPFGLGPKGMPPPQVKLLPKPELLPPPKEERQ